MKIAFRCVITTIALFLMLTCVSGAEVADEARLVDEFMSGRITGGLLTEVIKSYGSSAIPYVRAALKLTEDPVNSASLIGALCALKADGLERDIELALSMTKGKKREALKYHSILILRQIQTIDAVRIILDIIRDPDSESDDVQSLVRETIEMIKGQGIASVFIDELKRTDGLKELSIEKLGNIRAIEASVPLVPFLKDKSTSVRNMTAKALYLIADKRVMDKLEECLIEEKDEFVRIRIEGALIRMGNRDAVTMLRDRNWSQDDNPEAKVYAVNVQYCARFMGLVDDLAELTKDEQPRVRGKAVELLKGFGCMSAIPALEEVSLQDTSKDLREYALEVIVALKKNGLCACEEDF